jgi:Sulfotransferase family
MPNGPSFIIIGAVKAATTWTAHQLRVRPGLFLPGPEPHYFSTEFHRGPEWYARRFDAAPPGSMIGEKSADYLAHPEAARRIADALPGVRLIVQLRDPVARAYSDYRMLYRRGAVAADPRRYLSPSSAAGARFLENGRYASHLARFYEHFPRDRICLILYEEIQSDPARALDRACAHIGISGAPAPMMIHQRRNDGDAPLLPLSLRRLLRPAKGLARPFRQKRWFESMRSALARPVRYPALPGELTAELRDHYRDDVLQLEMLTGRDLSGWRAAHHAAGA